jgi:hypothetical protein
VHLPADDFWRSIRTGYAPTLAPAGAAQNTVVTDALANAAVTHVVGGYYVALDGVIGPWFPGRLLARAAASGVAVNDVALRPAQAVAAQWIRSRRSRTCLPTGTTRLPPAAPATQAGGAHVPPRRGT